MPDQERIKSVITDYYTAIREADEKAWLATFAEDAVSNDPVGAPPHEGHEGLAHFFQEITSQFDEVALNEQDIFIAGNGAGVKWTGEGTGKNGVDVNFEGIDVFEFNDEGTIQNLWAYWNPAPVMAKL